MSAVVGLDLSLTSTGVAVRDGTWKVTSKPGENGRDAKGKKRKPTLDQDIARQEAIHEQVLGLVVRVSPDLMVVEAPSFGSEGGSAHERAGLWWGLVREVRRNVCPVLRATPGGIKKYATGRGKADKDEVLAAAIRRFGWFSGGNDEADALWACAMGYDHLGEPLTDMPKLNREALIPWAA